MAERRVERRLAAIFATDVAGYSRLMGKDEEGTHAALKACRRELIDPKIAEHHGRIVKTTGDGALVEFASAVDATRCAMEIQRAMAERNASIPEDHRIELRIGINVGDIIIDKGDIYGDGVNIAARLETLASPGAICLSDNVHQQIKGKLPFNVSDMGDYQLKNIAQPVRVYRVKLDGAAAGLDPNTSLGRRKATRTVRPIAALRPLEADDAGIFFGRDGPIVEALDCATRLAGRSSATPVRHPRRVWRRQIVVPASRTNSAARARRPEFPAIADHQAGAGRDLPARPVCFVRSKARLRSPGSR